MDRGSIERIIKGVMVGSFLLAAIGMILLLSGCATPYSEPVVTVGKRHSTGPYLPSRDADPRVGLIVLEGEKAAAIDIIARDGQAEAVRINWPGRSPLAPTVNGRHRPDFKKLRLPFGSYNVVVRPYYYTANLGSRRRLVEGYVQRYYLRVDEQVSSRDWRYTGQYWGWIIYIDTGRIPRQHFSGPRTNIGGSGLPGWLLDQLFN